MGILLGIRINNGDYCTETNPDRAFFHKESGEGPARYRGPYSFGSAAFFVMRLYTTSATMAMAAVAAKMTTDSAMLPDTSPDAA